MSEFVWRPGLAVAGTALLIGLAFGGPAQAESIRKQCSEKYKAAKAANTLKGQSWNQFYKQCSAELKGAAAPAAAPPAPAPQAAPAAAPATAPAPAPATKPAKARSTAATPAPVVTAPIVFPRAISPQYANLKPGAARFKTCDDQYKANKATNSNGGLRWIQKGGGYYSECNKRLKGQ